MNVKCLSVEWFGSVKSEDYGWMKAGVVGHATLVSLSRYLFERWPVKDHQSNYGAIETGTLVFPTQGYKGCDKEIRGKIRVQINTERVKKNRARNMLQEICCKKYVFQHNLFVSGSFWSLSTKSTDEIK